MNNQEFIKYAANRFGVDEYLAETMIDMFAQTLQELVTAGQSVDIDGVGKFSTTPLFPNGLDHRNNATLVALAKKSIVSFKPSRKLIRDVA